MKTRIYYYCAALFALQAIILWGADATKAPVESAITFAPMGEVIVSIKRPWISIHGVTIVRVTDEEWAKIVAAYPEGVRNPDSKNSLTVYGKPKAEKK
jgi:hypothetical protein